MRIAIDISPIVYGTGVSVYTKELVRALLKIDKKNEYVLFGYSMRRKAELNKFTDSLSGNFCTSFIGLPPTLADLYWNRIHSFPVEQILGPIDIYHSSDWVEPKSRAKKVTTIHDLSPLKYPDDTHSKILSVHKRKLALVKKETDVIITPSKATKDDAIDLLGIDKERIVVIPEALSKHNVSGKGKKEGNYLLAVGASNRKNIKRTVEAFHKVKDKLKIDNLIVIGQSSQTHIQDKDVIFTGHVSSEELSKYYNGAKALVYASLYEGFGLPILEAFSAKIPVVTSSTSSMPEVAGSAAVLVNPEKVDDIARGIEKAINNKENLVKKGSKRLRDFSWEKTASETLKAYSSVYNKS